MPSGRQTTAIKGRVLRGLLIFGAHRLRDVTVCYGSNRDVRDFDRCTPACLDECIVDVTGIRLNARRRTVKQRT